MKNSILIPSENIYQFFYLVSIILNLWRNWSKPKNFIAPFIRKFIDKNSVELNGDNVLQATYVFWSLFSIFTNIPML